MELKGYQQKTLNQVKVYLGWLTKAKEEAARRQFLPSEFSDVESFDFSEAAWAKVSSGTYYSKKNGLGEGLPDFYIKIPTGGGKTLLACHVIDLINRIYLKKQTGIVLWIVPTTQIYRQTLEALRNRDHPYRQVLDMASAGRTIISEKMQRFSDFTTWRLCDGEDALQQALCCNQYDLASFTFILRLIYSRARLNPLTIWS